MSTGEHRRTFIFDPIVTSLNATFEVYLSTWNWRFGIVFASGKRATVGMAGAVQSRRTHNVLGTILTGDPVPRARGQSYIPACDQATAIPDVSAYGRQGNWPINVLRGYLLVHSNIPSIVYT